MGLVIRIYNQKTTVFWRYRTHSWNLVKVKHEVLPLQHDVNSPFVLLVHQSHTHTPSCKTKIIFVDFFWAPHHYMFIIIPLVAWQLIRSVSSDVCDAFDLLFLTKNKQMLVEELQVLFTVVPFVCVCRCSFILWSWSVWESASRLSKWSGAHLGVRLCVCVCVSICLCTCKALKIIRIECLIIHRVCSLCHIISVHFLYLKRH